MWHRTCTQNCTGTVGIVSTVGVKTEKAGSSTVPLPRAVFEEALPLVLGLPGLSVARPPSSHGCPALLDVAEPHGCQMGRLGIAVNNRRGIQSSFTKGLS